MKPVLLLVCVISLGACCNSAVLAEIPAAQPSLQVVLPLNADEVLRLSKKVAEWRIANPETPKNSYWNRGWEQGAFFAGLMALYKSSHDPIYLDTLLAVSKENQWRLGPSSYHADDQMVGQTYLELYELRKDPQMLATVRQRLDHILANPIQAPYGVDKPRSDNRWSWSDSLFMAPPLWAQMAAITGDKRYSDFMDKEWWATAEFLFDPQLKLFYRDQRFFTRLNRNGKKVLWSRGNGWVYAAIPRILKYLPEDHPSRPRYIQLFKDMTEAIVKAQGPDGLWRPNLVDAEDVPKGETSGSSFFVYGLMWGINQGVLDADKYLPVVKRGWSGLTSSVWPDGMLGWVQPADGEPRRFKDNSSTSFATGAFLLAGSEIYNYLTRPTAVSPRPATWARYVPERLDDFGWENDLVAFRAYGPAIKTTRGTENSGIDCWLKRVPYPIIDKWYAGESKGISYHEDRGEGYDPYHVGASRGCGGTGIWDGEKMVLSGPYKSWKIISREPQRTIFELTYEYDFKGEKITEVKRISIELGQRLFRSESTFTRAGQPAALDIAIGLTTHNGRAIPTFDKKRGVMSCWEKIGDYGLGTGVVIEPKKVLKIFEVKTKTPDESHALLLTRTDAAGKVGFSAGYGWEKAGEITTPEKWQEWLFAANRNR